MVEWPAWGLLLVWVMDRGRIGFVFGFREGHFLFAGSGTEGCWM